MSKIKYFGVFSNFIHKIRFFENIYIFWKISALLKISIELMFKLPMCGCVLGAKFHENAIK
jgi:hypothetical protein